MCCSLSQVVTKPDEIRVWLVTNEAQCMTSLFQDAMPVVCCQNTDAEPSSGAVLTVLHIQKNEAVFDSAAPKPGKQKQVSSKQNSARVCVCMCACGQARIHVPTYMHSHIWSNPHTHTSTSLKMTNSVPSTSKLFARRHLTGHKAQAVLLCIPKSLKESVWNRKRPGIRRSV